MTSDVVLAINYGWYVFDFGSRGARWGVDTEHSSGKQTSSRTPDQLRSTAHLREETRVCASDVIRGLRRVLVHVSQRFFAVGEIC